MNQQYIDVKLRCAIVLSTYAPDMVQATAEVQTVASVVTDEEGLDSTIIVSVRLARATLFTYMRSNGALVRIILPAEMELVEGLIEESEANLMTGIEVARECGNWTHNEQ